MKKMLLLMAMAVLVCWLPGQAMAATTYTSTLNTLSADNNLTTAQKTTAAGDYGTVSVTVSGTTATVTVTPTESPLDIDFNNGSTGPGNSVALDLNSTYVTLSSVTGVSSDGLSHPLSISTGSALTYDAGDLGTFDVIGTLTDGYSNEELMTFTMTVASGTTASEVLLANSSGFDAGEFVEVESTTNTAYIGEKVSAVPVPSTALLLGSALMGLALLGFRRKGTLFQL